MPKKIDYNEWSKDELIKEIRRIKETKYGLVWHRDLPEEKIDILINPDADTPSEMFPNEMTGKPFPVLKEVKAKAIETNKTKPTNILIEGDNFHSLVTLNFTHKEAIDLIYIDPPYNTGNNDFIYNDKIKSDYVKNDDPFRHSKWLSFMEKRLKLAKNLLKPTGSIFISIDDNEQAPLKLLCDEIFGAESFVTTIHVQMSTVSGQKVRAAKGGNIVKNAEYLLVYSKSGQKNIGKNLLYDPVEYDTHYSIFLTSLSEGVWKESSFIDECLNNEEIFNILSISGLATIKNGKKNFSINSLQKAYSSIEKFRDFVHQNADRIVRTDRMVEVEPERLEKNIKPNFTYTYKHKNKKSYLYGVDKKGEIKQRFLLSEKIRNADDFYKTYGITNLRGDWWPGFHLDMGNVPKEGGVDFLNGKKPVRLIKQIINFCLDKDGIVLDFFAGSGTTGHAILELNKEKKSEHSFILCTNNENNICREKTYPRLNNAIKGYKDKEALGGNLKYYTCTFVEAEPTDRNKRKLVNESTEMLSIKEGAFEPIYDGADFKILKNSEKYLGIVFDEDSIQDFIKQSNKLKGTFVIYCFSYAETSLEKEFSDFKNYFKIKPLPEVILRVYRDIYRK